MERGGTTIPETKSSPLKNAGWNDDPFLFGDTAYFLELLVLGGTKPAFEENFEIVSTVDFLNHCKKGFALQRRE